MVYAVNFNNIDYSDYKVNENITNYSVNNDESIIIEETGANTDEFITESDSVIDTEAETSTEEITSVEELEEKFENIQAEQGIIGQTVDKIKNKIPFLSKLGFKGSEEVQAAIEKVKSGEMTLEEAEEILEKYESNQNTMTEVILDTATLGMVSAVCLLAGPLGWGALTVIGIATATGAASRVIFGAVEAATNEVEGDYTSEDIQEDAIKGGIIGFLKGLGKVFGCKFKKPKPKDIESAIEYATKGVTLTNLYKGIKLTT